MRQIRKRRLPLRREFAAGPMRRLVLIFLSAWLMVPTHGMALDFPKPTEPDPMRLRVCAVTFFGSGSADCELLGLVGPVARIANLTEGKLDREYKFDRSGRVTEENSRIKALFGGWTRIKYVYRQDGLPAAISHNGSVVEVFKYSGQTLSRRI